MQGVFTTPQLRRALNAALAADGISCLSGQEFTTCRMTPQPPTPPPPPNVSFTYDVEYASPSFLSEAILDLYKNSSCSAGSAQATSLASSSTQVSSSSQATPLGDGDFTAASTRLICSVPPSDVEGARTALIALDQKPTTVKVEVLVYEIDSGSGTQSPYYAISSILESAGALAAASATGPAVLAGSVFTSVQSAMSTQTDAHLVDAPILTVTSGLTGSFTAGESVPTLSGSSTSEGTTTQSVAYQQAGVSFAAEPTVYQKGLSLALSETVSSFEQTTTGVNDTPTLINRSVTDDITLPLSSSTIVLGSLASNSSEAAKTGFSWLPFHFGSTTQNTSESILVIVRTEVMPSAS
jgi:general secretion pathway protein D